MDITNLSEADQLQLAEYLKDVLWWSENFLQDPDTLLPFKANHVQRLMFGKKKTHKRIVIRVHRRAGKATPLETAVYTPEGRSTMGDMKVGSTVCTPDGGSSIVAEIHPQGIKQVHRVYFDDGTHVDCCEDHLWEVYTKFNQKDYSNKVLSTFEIAQNLVECVNGVLEYNYQVNPVSSVFHTKKDVPIHPYILGVLLGDGNLPRKEIVSKDPQILNRIEEILEKRPILRSSLSEGNIPHYILPEENIQDKVKELGLDKCTIYNKFIPDKYLYSSIEDRLELLRGIMDMDGFADSRKAKAGQVEFTTVSERLADNIAELARSLGCKVFVVKLNTKSIIGKCYRLAILIPGGLRVFHSKQKHCEGLNKRYLRKKIVKVDLYGWKEMQCISLDSKKPLYVTENYTPTHNSHGLAVLALHGATVYRSYEVLVVAPDQGKVAEIFGRIRAFISVNPALQSSVVSDGKSPERIQFKNGSTIQGKTTGSQGSNKGRGLRGKGADLVIIDECAFLADGDYTALNPIIMGDTYRRDGVQVYAASTPIPDQNRYWEWCFPSGTLITLGDGKQAPIEELGPGDRILAWDGAQDTVVRSYAHRHQGELVQVKTVGTPYELEATSEHPVWIRRAKSESSNFAPISTITPGDFLAITIQPASKEPVLLDYPELAVDRLTEERLGKDPEASLLQCIDTRRQKTWNKVKSEIDRYNHAILDDENSENLIYIENLYKLIGFYLAEGCAVRSEGFDKGIQFAFHSEEQDLIEEVRSSLCIIFPDQTNKVVNQTKYGQKSNLVIAYGSWLPTFFRHLCGEFSNGKRLHPALFQSKYAQLALNTYWLGDGYLSSSSSRSFATTSRELALQVQQLCARSGKPASLQTMKKNNRLRAYIVLEYVKPIPSRAYVEDSFLYVKVLEKKTIPFTDIVYNLETKRTHTYVANGFAVHNCTQPERGWEQIYVPITDNPDWSPERIEEIRSYVSDMEWEQEYCAEFPSLGENAIRKEDIQACQFKFNYDANYPRTGAPRVMGVDWDKVQAGVNVAIVEMNPLTGKHRIVYREEMPRSAYSLTNAVNRIIALSSTFDPDFIYCDRGFNEMGVETLKLHGLNHPSTQLHKKVVGVSFSEHVEIPDPVDGKVVQKRFKGVMVNLLFKLLEDHRLEFPQSDKEFEKQLSNYKIISISDAGLKTASKKEHIFDAVGLACWGLFHKFANSFKRTPARKAHMVAMPKIVKTKETIRREKNLFAGQGTALSDNQINKTWARGTFSTQPIKRSTF
jgi:intein/homing endonuclease